MLAPRLRHRITIERLQQTRDQWGGIVEAWVTFAANVPAEIVPLSGREFTASQAGQAGLTARVTIRQISGVEPAMRISHDGALYNIKAVLPDPTLRRHLTLMCETGIREG